ncbi:MAG TPA: serine protease [Mycobacteriales bacterium]|nr:serine protease [Mycobacteriales bacterium]
MLLGSQHVLTCAHVIMDAPGCSPGVAGGTPFGKVVVDFVGIPGAESATATVLPDCFAPPRDDERGDVALLELDRPRRGGTGTPLRRMPPRLKREVHTLGFPDGLQHGMWVPATLTLRCGPDGEWMQMNTTAAGGQVVRGFSGAGVVDNETGNVIGMVVSHYSDKAAGLSWMLPVETIIRHVPKVADWVSGDKAVDESFGRPLGPSVPDRALSQEVTNFLIHPGTERLKTVVTGGHDSASSAALRLAVALSDPERSKATDEVLADALPGATPPLGSVDLAVNATDKTAAEVAARIADRTGIQVDNLGRPDREVARTPSMTLVVDAVDDAADPDQLVDEVLAPIARRAAELGIRLILAFRRESSAGLRTLREIEATERLGRVTTLANELAAAEEKARHRYAYVASRVTAAPVVTIRAPRYLSALGGLRAADDRRDLAWVLAWLGSCERKIIRDLSEVTRTDRRLSELLARRGDLRGRLDSYKAMAADHDLAEDLRLAGLYRKAWELLWWAPCDLSVADAAVGRYAQAVRQRCVPGGEDIR